MAGMFFTAWLALHCAIVPICPLPNIPPTVQDLPEVIHHTDIDWAFLAPSMIEEIGKTPDLLDVVASRLRQLFFAGGSVSRQHGDTIARRMGLYQVFGTSEMGIWPLIAPVGEHDYRDWAYVQVHPAVAVQ